MEKTKPTDDIRAHIKEEDDAIAYHRQRKAEWERILKLGQIGEDLKEEKPKVPVNTEMPSTTLTEFTDYFRDRYPGHVQINELVKHFGFPAGVSKLTRKSQSYINNKLKTLLKAGTIDKHKESDHKTFYRYIKSEV